VHTPAAVPQLARIELAATAASRGRASFSVEKGTYRTELDLLKLILLHTTAACSTGCAAPAA
jgi:hypothetical protein